MRFLLVVTTTAFGCLAGTWAGDPPAKITPVVVWTGTDSSLSKPSFERCGTADEWRATWDRHTQDNGDAGRPAAQVDFGAYMVLALFQGDGSQNYGLRVIEILDEPDCLRVRYETAYYQTAGTPESEADRRKLDTRSYAFVVVPRSNKAVTFEVSRRQTIDQPPGRWEKVGSVPAVGRK